MKRLSFYPGRVNGFLYPAHNSLDLPLEFVTRNVKTYSVRDLAREPLDLESFVKAPFKRRGRFLMKGFDLDLKEDRCFYLDAIKGCRLPYMRLAIYDTNCPEQGPVSRLEQLFAPTVEDCRLLADTIRCFRKNYPHKWSGNPYELAIFPEVLPCPFEF